MLFKTSPSSFFSLPDSVSWLSCNDWLHIWHSYLQNHILHIFSLVVYEWTAYVILLSFLFKCRKQAPRVEGTGYCSTILLRSSVPFLFPARRSKAFTNMSYASCNSQCCLYSFQFFLSGLCFKIILYTRLVTLVSAFLLKKKYMF